MAEQGLRIGFGEVEITPPTGLDMCGSLQPRTNVGNDDPLMAKTLVASANGKSTAIVGVDLIGLPREYVDPAIKQAAARTGLEPGSIMVCAAIHTAARTPRRACTRLA